MLSVIAILAAAVLFGTTGTAQALGPHETTPLAVGVMRMVVGGTGLAVVAFTLARQHRRRSPIPGRGRPGIRPLLLMSLTGVCLAGYQPRFFLGTARNGVAVSTVIALGSAPVLAGLLEWALTRRVPSRAWIVATALATVGVVLLGLGGASGAGGTDPVGVAGADRLQPVIAPERQAASRKDQCGEVEAQHHPPEPAEERPQRRRGQRAADQKDDEAGMTKGHAEPMLSPPAR